MVSALFALAAGFAGLASAMSSSNYSSPYSVDPSTVAASLKASWCNNQQTTCLDICNNQASPNSCDPTSLAWTCTCSSFTTPNISNYEQTVPFFECQQYIANCQVANTQNAAAQRACLAINCGTGNATTLAAVYSNSANGISATSSASAASSSTAATSGTSASTSKSATGTASATAAASSTAAAAALSWGQTYSLGALGAGAFALFGLAL